MAQGLVARSPRAEAFAFELAFKLNVNQADVVVDVLLACGLGHESAADHIAACSARFVENTKKYGSPDVVIVVGQHARAAVIGAGLIDGQYWAPVGAARSPAFVTQTWSLPRGTAADISRVLGTKCRIGRAPKKDLSIAQKLLGALGWGDGSASRGRTAESWKRRKTSPLTVERVDMHLRGKCFWAPFRPRGEWPFVVVDADRHDALQEFHAAETMKQLRQHLPSGFFIESSTSGGLHVYVKLPPNVQYHEAATWLEAYFALKKLLVLEKKVARAGRPLAILRSSRLEVPRHPVRLPFGHGSSIVKARSHAGSQPADTARTKVNAFIDWLQASSTTDFERAQQFVMAQLKINGRWSLEKKALLERSIEEAHVAGFSTATLPHNDPWFNIVPQLTAGDRALRVIASRGVPAMGTRTRWTERLVDVLFDIVPPDEAEQLMLHWLRDREHNSEDIEIDPPGVEAALRRKIEAKKKIVQGVPMRVWTAVEERLQRGWGILHTTQKPGWMLPVEMARRLRPLLQPGTLSELAERHDWLRRTAFFILRRFFDRRARTTDGSDGERPIPRREFSAFLPNDMQAAVKEFFLLAGWLGISGRYEKGVSARKFKLAGDLWPSIPGEDVLFVVEPKFKGFRRT